MILSDFSVRRPVAATMLIASLLVLGVFSFLRLGIDLFPHFDIPTVTITTTLAGAGPEEIETTITKPIEEVVNTISGIDELRSSTVEGLSRVVVLFHLEREVDAAAQDVRSKVSTIVADFPEGTDPPVVDKFDLDATPVMSLTVTGDQTLKELTEIAKKRVKEPLEGLSGVGAIELVGGREREIQVEVSADRLQAYELTASDVARALAAQNVEIPAGRMVQGSSETVVRTLGRVRAVPDFARIPVANRQGTPITVGDVGEVRDAVVEPRSLSRYNGVNAVTLSVRKQSGANTIAVVDAIRAQIPAIETTLPAGVSLRVTRDWSDFIRYAVTELEWHLVTGGILASLVVLVFLANLRSTLIAALAIPTSVIASFTVMYAMGFTVNRITLLALTLSVGIVIDDAIVVLENIYRQVEEKAMAPLEAARKGAADVGLAVSATTLSLVIVFLPLALLPGITGRFLHSFGVTMACAILVSYLVAFTLTPVLCSRWLRSVAVGSGHRSSRESRLFAPIDRTYSLLLGWSMRHRLPVVGGAVVLILSVPTLMGWTGAAFMPEDDRAEFEVNVKFPQGVSLAQVDRMLEHMEKAIEPIPEVLGLLTTVGGAGDVITTGQIFVQLAAHHERSLHQFAVMDEVRRRLAPFRGEVRMSVDNPPPVKGSGFRAAEINYNVRGPDLSVVERYGRKIWQAMERLPDVVDLDTTAEPGKPELRVLIDREKASDLGVQVADIARALRLMINGEVITQYKEGIDLYDVRLRLREADRQTAEALARVTVPSRTLGQVRLDNLVSLRPGTGPAQIDRQGRQRQVTLLANVATGRALGDVLEDVDREVEKMGLPPGYVTDVSGRGKLFGETVVGFQVAITLSLIFMYMVLAAQFESFIHPLTIMLSLPLAVPFALLSLWTTGNTLNLFSGLGVMLLFGIVKKNAILQVDHTLALRRSGVARAEAIMTANRERLRPILMTTIALVAGMTPAALAQGPGAASANAIAIVVIGGQTLCLLITLLVTPVAYSLFEDLGAATRAGVTWLRGTLGSREASTIVTAKYEERGRRGCRR